MFSIVRRRINYRLIATRLTSTNTSASSTGGATAEEAKPASNDVVLELQKQLEVKALEVSELKDLYRRYSSHTVYTYTLFPPNSTSNSPQ